MLREGAGLSIGELSARAGIAAEQLSRIERDEVDVGLGELRLLASALGVTLSVLVAHDLDPPGREVSPRSGCSRPTER